VLPLQTNSAALESGRGRASWPAFNPDAATEVLDLLSVGFVLTNAGGRIYCANNAASNSMRAADGLFDNNGVLCAETAADTQALRDMIRRAANEGASGTLLIRRSREVRPHAVGVRPCHSHGETLALVAIQDNGQKSQAYVERIRSMFRLAPAEADIVVQLALGADLPEIAASRGVKINTIRTQMASAMVKVGVRRQAELVAAVAGLNILA
jgi:DNA-binding CsgD family transcriptional regulator